MMFHCSFLSRQKRTQKGARNNYPDCRASHDRAFVLLWLQHLFPELLTKGLDNNLAIKQYSSFIYL